MESGPVLPQGVTVDLRVDMMSIVTVYQHYSVGSVDVLTQRITYSSCL